MQLGSSYVSVVHEDPKVFIDCRDAPLYAYSGLYDVPIIDQVTALNRPQTLISQIAVGRKEDRTKVIYGTISLTLSSFAATVWYLVRKANSTAIKVQV